MLAFGLFAGCGGQDYSGGDEAVFRIGGIQVDTLNPLTTYMGAVMEFLMLVYDSLTHFDENLDPIPRLAESWELDDDGLTWTFHLVQGATWHDGTPLTAHDVKFSYDLMIDNGLGWVYSAYIEGIVDISCPDDYTVVMVTDEPKVNMLTNPTPILPMHIWSEIPVDELEVEMNEHPIGSGPFKFHSKDDAGTFWRLERNDDYFGPKPHIDALVFVYHANINTMTQALILGEIDGFFLSEASQLSTLRADSNIHAISAEVPGFVQIGINIFEEGTGHPALRDVNVRYAMDYALDREKIKEMVFYGCAQVGSTLMAPAGKWHYDVPASELRTYDLEKANKILDDAGYTQRNSDGTRLMPDGTPLEFDIVFSTDMAFRAQVASFLASGCDEIGIKINAIINDSSIIIDAIAEYSYDLFVWGWFEDVDPTSMLNVVTTEEWFYNNEYGFSDERYDELFQLQRIEFDFDARLGMIHEMQQILYEACPHMIVVYEEDIQAVRSDRWTGAAQVPRNTGPFFINNTYNTYLNLRPVE